MEYVEAFTIVSKLADGRHPRTGEPLPDGSLYNEPQIIRALVRGAELLNQRAQWEIRKKSQPANSGKPWMPEDDTRLVREYELGAVPADLAKSFQRTVGSIEARLVKLGKLDEAAVPFGRKVQAERPVFTKGS